LTTALTGSSARDYEHTDLTVDWLLTRYNLALAQAVLYDATEMRITVWDHFGTVFSYVKLFGLMHRIYPIDPEGERVASTDLEGSALLIRIQYIGWESGRLHTLPCGRELGPALT
jgi:predicted nuclease of restriction endonuclease-like RecB superfamily